MRAIPSQPVAPRVITIVTAVARSSAALTASTSRRKGKASRASTTRMISPSTSTRGPTKGRTAATTTPAIAATAPVIGRPASIAATAPTHPTSTGHGTRGRAPSYQPAVIPTRAPVALAMSVAAEATTSVKRAPEASRANTSRNNRSAPSGNEALGPTGRAPPAMPWTKSLSSGPWRASPGPATANTTSAATMTAPTRAERLPAKRARTWAASTLPPCPVGQEGGHRRGELQRALLRRRGAAVEHLEARAAELTRQPAALLEGRVAMAPTPRDERRGGHAGDAGRQRACVQHRAHRRVGRLARRRHVEELEEMIHAPRRPAMPVRMAPPAVAREEAAAEEGAPVELLEEQRSQQRDGCDSRQRVGPWWVDERVDEHELVDDVRVRGRHREGNGAPHRVTAEGHAPQADGGDEVDNGLTECVEIVPVAARGRLLALAEPRQIRGHDAESLRKTGQDVLPRDPAGQVIVKEHERRSAAGLDEPNARAPRGDIANRELSGSATLVVHDACLRNIGRRTSEPQARGRGGPREGFSVDGTYGGVARGGAVWVEGPNDKLGTAPFGMKLVTLLGHIVSWG